MPCPTGTDGCPYVFRQVVLNHRACPSTPPLLWWTCRAPPPGPTGFRLSDKQPWMPARDNERTVTNPARATMAVCCLFAEESNLGFHWRLPPSDQVYPKVSTRWAFASYPIDDDQAVIDYWSFRRPSGQSTAPASRIGDVDVLVNKYFHTGSFTSPQFGPIS